MPPATFELFLVSPPEDSRALASAAAQEAGSRLDCIGISHHTAASDLRERAAFTGPRLREALAAARHDRRIERLTIISTCHRTELYAELPDRAMSTRDTLLDWWARTCNVPADEIAPHTFSHAGLDAARHLFRVATGLDSVVLGEAQIVSQVAGALRQSVAVHAASPLLKLVFKRAVHAGERARGAVWGRLQAASLGSAAVDAAAAAADGLLGRTVVVVGAGEIAELAVRALGAHSPARIVIANRTLASADELAKRHGAHACDLESLAPAVLEADVVIAATRASLPLIRHPMIGSVMNRREARRLTIVDVSLPRNVDVDVRGVKGTQLIGIDDLGPYIAAAHANRRAAVPAVESIVDEELVRLLERLERRFAGEPRPAVAAA